MVSTKPLVHFPSPRLAPKEVIQRLREIDETFELVWLVDHWRLGRVRPTTARYYAGGRMLRTEMALPEPDPLNIGYARLVMQGFATTAGYQHEPDGRIVKDARVRMYNLRNRREAAFRERLDETMGGPQQRERQRVAADWGRSMASEAWRRGFKRPVTVRR
jgi:hypothetical protein